MILIVELVGFVLLMFASEEMDKRAERHLRLLGRRSPQRHRRDEGGKKESTIFFPAQSGDEEGVIIDAHVFERIDQAYHLGVGVLCKAGMLPIGPSARFHRMGKVSRGSSPYVAAFSALGPGVTFALLRPV